MYGADAVALFFTAAFKLFLSFPAARLLGYTYWETMAITCAGGMSGTTFFYVFSARVMELHRVRTLKRIARKKAQGKQVSVRYFTFMNKLMVRVKNRVGIVGMAIITPTILSIPIGAVVSAKFFKHNPWMLPVLLLSVFLWALLLTTLTRMIEF